jgi:hypothetical protein
MATSFNHGKFQMKIYNTIFGLVLGMFFSGRLEAKVIITDLYTRPDWKTGFINVQVRLTNDIKATTNIVCVFKVAPGTGGETLKTISMKVSMENGTGMASAQLALQNFRLWDIDSPYLYNVSVTAQVVGESDFVEMSTRCGFRDFRFEQGYFRLNGRRIFLHGVLTGSDTPFSPNKPYDATILRKELVQLKTMGFNMVRYLGGIAQTEQLNLADEIGLLVYEEHNASWLMFNKKPAVLERFDAAITEMINRDRNHPCVVIWGLFNEEGHTQLFHHGVNCLPLVRTLDDSRLVILNSGRLDGHTREAQGSRGPGVATWRTDWMLTPNVSLNETDKSISRFEVDYGGGSRLNLEGSTWLPQQVALHPGLNGEYSVVRWTAPSKGLYKMSASFTAIAPHVHSDIHILQGDKSIYSAIITNEKMPAAECFNTINVTKGENIYAVVGNGNEFPCREGVNTTCICDNTALNLTFTSSDGKIYDLTKDFSTTQNPNGVWSYGYLPDEPHPDASKFITYYILPYERNMITGTISNPGSTEWEDSLSDRHRYIRIPSTATYLNELRSIRDEKCPVFLSEYGAGSGIDLSRLSRLCSMHGVKDAFETRLQLFHQDWHRWNMANTFGTPEVFFRQSLEAAAARRSRGINAVRSNPNIVGHVITGNPDSWTGLGIMTTFGEPKPGSIDALIDGLSPLRWCLFVEPTNSYSQSPVKLDVVLANEDKLPTGEYPFTIRVLSPDGQVVFERREKVKIAGAGGKSPIVIPVFSDQIIINGTTGKYQCVVDFDQGAAAAGGRTEFYVTNPKDMPEVKTTITLWKEDPKLEQWLKIHGIMTKNYEPNTQSRREVILASYSPAAPGGREAFRELALQIARGSAVVFLCPEVFTRDGDPAGWVPLVNKGALADIGNPVWPKDEWAAKHPIFDGLPCGGILDQTYYLDLISDLAWVGKILDKPLFVQDVPSEAVAGAINTGHTGSGYESGLMVRVDDLGEGRFILNTLRIYENLGTNPVAERLLRNMLNYASINVSKPLGILPSDFDAQLKKMGL